MKKSVVVTKWLCTEHAVKRMNERNGRLSKKIGQEFPEIFIDEDLDFASIKLSKGVESRSYIKDGFIFCEDRHGRIIEIQVLNLSQLDKKSKTSKRKK